MNVRESLPAPRRIAALASDPAVHRAFGWLHLHEPQMRRWQLEFLPLSAPPFSEAARATWFLERFQALGLEACHIDAEGNVLGERRGPTLGEHRGPAAAAGPVVLVSAHLDTVFPAETNCTPREDGARIHCPGACDNGAGLTALLGLAAAFQMASRVAPLTVPCTLLFAANVGEEGEGDLRGMRHLFSGSPFSSRLRAALALEGGGTGTVVDRALGGRRLRVTVSGPGGHSWADAGLPNPILALASALLDVSRIPLPESPRTTLNCGTIAGGTSVNSIPERATADLDLRSASGRELDRLEIGVLERLTRAVNAQGVPRPAMRGAADPLRLHVERIGDRPAAALASGSPLRLSLEAVDRHLQLQTDFRLGSTDANLPLSLGIPALAIGAGGMGGGIHTLREWYDPTGRELALRRILLLLLDTAWLAATEPAES